MILAPQNEKFQIVESCLRCSRTLTNPVSMYVGFGPVCSEHLGIERPRYDDLIKLNPDIPEQLEKLKSVRQELEQNLEILGHTEQAGLSPQITTGNITLKDERVIITFDWECENFHEIKDKIKSLGCRWNPAEKQWEAPQKFLSAIIKSLQPYPNIAVDKSLAEIVERNPETYASDVSAPTLLSIVTQMIQRLKTVPTTKVTLKNGLQLFLKKDNDFHKVLCARDDTLPSKTEIKVVGDAFFGEDKWVYGNAKTDVVTLGYVIIRIDK